MHKFLLGGSAAGLVGYLFTFYMHPEVFEHWVRLIQYGEDSGTTILPKTQDADASVAFLKLKDPEVRGILDRVSLEEAYAAMDILSCNGECDLSRKSYAAAEARLIFKLLGLMNGSSSERGQITSLRLVNCDLQGRKNSSGKVFKELKDSLGMNRIFRELELRRCNISDAMLLELAEAIKPAVWLTKLDLSENEFGDESLAAFSQFLRKTTLSLTSLSLVGKQNHRKDGRITDEGAKQLAKAITRSENNTGLVALRHLDLSHNNLGESGAAELLRALGDLQKKNGGSVEGSEVRLILLHNNIPDPSKAQLQNLAKTVGVRLDI
jgi:hypothetical protein